jgi:hypothetical protein
VKRKAPYMTPRCMRLTFDPDGDAKNPWVVQGDHKFIYGTIPAIVVPDCFRTDLASVPFRKLWVAAWLVGWLVGYWCGPVVGLVVGLPLAVFVAWVVNPYGNEQRAALFHDQAYRQQDCSRFTADAAFRSIMERDGVNWLRTVVLYYGVRFGGRKAWREHRRAVEASENA